MKGNVTLEGVTYATGEPVEIVSVSCPQGCNGRLQPTDTQWVCLECGCVFDTMEEDN